MTPPQQDKALYREARHDLAIQAYKSGQFQALQPATKSFDIPRTTTRRRISGIRPQRGSRAVNRLLTSTEEETLVQWILSMDRRGMPPRAQAVRQMAGLLLSQRGRAASVGINWATRFINRDERLKSKYNRKYDYQRAKCEDPSLIRPWFQRVQSTIAEYGILTEDIYNFDETGFQMGVIATAKVVTGTDRQGRPRTVQPGNREWVTIIETIGAGGFSIPPLVILEGIMHQAAWYDNGLVPLDWSVTVSENGWTNNEIGLYWLEHVFNKYTIDRTVGTHRLLILDGHGSHVTPEFDQYCLNQRIIVLCMPAHSSHLLQPLDVGCFAALKRSYGRRVEMKMGLGVNHIDKQEFLLLYQQARAEALHESNIRSGFAATGLVPYEPDRVLSLLQAQIQTPSPQLQPQPDISPYTTATPHNIIELQQQTELVKQYLKRHTQSPPSPAEQALGQLLKGCQMAMHSAVLLVSQNEQLTAENQRQKRKRAQRRTYIARGGVLTGAEAQVLINNGESSRGEALQERQGEARQRAPPRCSLCGSLEHKAPTCPGYQRLN
jgi:hypothetical protein